MPGSTIRVKATAQGFYGELRKVGDIFNVKEQHKAASWYAPAGLDGQFDKPKTDLEDNREDDNEEDGLDDSDDLNLDEDNEDLVGNLGDPL